MSMPSVRGGLPGGGPLEDVTGVDEAVLLHAGQVGVAGPGLGEGLLGRTVLGQDRHLLLPLVGVALPLGVGDLHRHRRAERAAVADPAQDPDLVDLEAHARPPAVAQPAPPQLLLDLLDPHLEPGWQPLDDDDEGRSVGLTSGQEAEHGWTLPADPTGPEALHPGHGPARKTGRT
jgi:hypothetical protein